MLATVFYGGLTLNTTWYNISLSEYARWAKTYLIDIQSTLGVATSTDVVSVKFNDGYTDRVYRVNRYGILTLWLSSAYIQNNLVSLSSSVSGGVSKTVRVIASDEGIPERYKYYAAVSVGAAGSNLTLFSVNTPGIYFGRMGYRFNNSTANTATLNVTSTQGYSDQTSINIAANTLTHGAVTFYGGLDASATFTAVSNISTGFIHVTLWL